MQFFLKRYILAVSRRRLWLWLAVVAGVFSYAVFTVIPDRFSVEQEVLVTKEATLAVGPRGGDGVKAGDLVSSPDKFFLDDFALILLDKHLQGTGKAKGHLTPALKGWVKDTMSITFSDRNSVLIVYEGEDKELGREFVAFYAQRLLSRARTGPGITKRLPGDLQKGSIEGFGTMRTEDRRTLWRSSRACSSLTVFAVTLGVLLIAMGLLEWMDPSFKSERDVARYLGAPILGSLPDFERVTKALRPRS